MTHEERYSTVHSEARKLALEIVATLVNVKKIAADQLLRPVGIPEPFIRHFLKGRDTTTGETLTKRQAFAFILDELAKTGADHDSIRKLVAIASGWDQWHLAQEEYKARAVVQKAREQQGVLAEADAREKERVTQAVEQEQVRRRQEKEATVRKGSELLLQQFDQAVVEGEAHDRGFLLQDLLNRMFILHNIAVRKSFQRNDGAEQIDGAFELNGWQYLVECRWRKKLADIRELDGLYGQIRRSGKQTMGLFLSINGWSEHVIDLMKQNPEKCIVLMEGFDLRSVLAIPFDLRKLLEEKVRALNLDAEPYLAIDSIKARRPG